MNTTYKRLTTQEKRIRDSFEQFFIEHIGRPPTAKEYNLRKKVEMTIRLN
jgi:hypothetical protein